MPAGLIASRGVLMPAEDEPNHRGDGARAADGFGEGGSPWALRAPGGRPLVRAALRRADYLQAAHPARTPVLQEPPGGYAQVHPAVPR